jgi:hypothetical protein
MSQQPATADPAVTSTQRDHWIAQTAAAIAAVYVASKADMLSRVRLGHVFDALRAVWPERLTAVLEEHSKAVAATAGQSFAEQFGATSFDPRRMDAWLQAGAQARAEGWRQGIEDLLRSASLSVADIEAEVKQILDDALSADKAKQDASDLVDSSINFSQVEAAKAAGKTTKTWHHVPGEKSSRADHQAIDGETVGIDDRFSVGLRFPRSPGPPGEVLNCRCYLTYGGGK